MLMLIIPNLSESGCPGFEDVQDDFLIPHSALQKVVYKNYIDE
jgi:hypothetical protein